MFEHVSREMNFGQEAEKLGPCMVETRLGRMGDSDDVEVKISCCSKYLALAGSSRP